MALRELKLGLLLAVASLFSCDDGPGESAKRPEERHCVEGDKYVDDALCTAEEGRDGGGASGTVAMGGPRYHYVYVPYGYYWGPGFSAGAFAEARLPGSGNALVSSGRGGAPATGVSSAHSSGVARGGFGSTGAAHASGGGSATAS